MSLTKRPSYRPSLRNAHKRIMVEIPLYKGTSTICSCGGRIELLLLIYSTLLRQ